MIKKLRNTRSYGQIYLISFIDLCWNKKACIHSKRKTVLQCFFAPMMTNSQVSENTHRRRWFMIITNAGHQMQQAVVIQIWFTFVQVPLRRWEQAPRNVSSHLVVIQSNSFYWACYSFSVMVVYLSFLFHPTLLCHLEPWLQCLCVFHS